MRMMMTVQVPNEAGSRAINDGTLPKVLGELHDRLRPEATYFFATDGHRTAQFVFDMKDSSEIPPLAEPLFQQLNAAVTLLPVMNLDELQKGLGALQR